MAVDVSPTAPFAVPQVSEAEPEVGPAWQSTACILCECNCGIEVRLGGPGDRRFERIRGDKAHPASAGYTCEKALRLDHYQNGADRLTAPLRRRPDGTFEEIDWETAITEIAQRLVAVKDAYGGESIFYYGGGGQGNHLGGGYSGATLRALGARFRSSALAQEKTGEFFVNGQMIGGLTRGDFEHCEVAVFIGKNPYQSHGMPRARTLLKEIGRDPLRSMIVLDPRRTETADLADFHLQVIPGTDAWCLSAMVAILVQEGLVDRAFIEEHTVGFDRIVDLFGDLSIADAAQRCGVDETLIRSASRRIARAVGGVAVFEDLGVQMNRHSTLNSWLEKLLWALTGNFARQGAQYIPTSLVPLASASGRAGAAPVSPVVGARIIGGLVPCNVIAEEILSDHPRRYRAMIVESGNPVHSLADSQQMRAAMRALDLLVVIDVAMTETAQEANYVLPVPTQYEKWESTFFNFDFPHNVFHLRRPILEAPAGVLPEPEIHARLVEAIGALTEEDLAPLRVAAAESRGAFADAFFAALAAKPSLGAIAPVVLYRTLGPTLADGAASAALLWGAVHKAALNNPRSLAAAGFDGEGLAGGEALFDAILDGRSGTVFSIDDWDEIWRRVSTDDGRIHLVVDELLEEFDHLSAGPPAVDPDFPVMLSAGERRSFTANTIFRDPAWRKRDADGALRISPGDAIAYGVADGGRVRLTTRRGSAVVDVEVSDSMRDGHVALPNGMGIGGAGVAPNELTDSADRDPIAGTPWHKSVPARLEAVG